MQRIGLVGVGFSGKLFTDRLRGAEYPLVAYDVDDSQVAYATDRGAEAADSPAAVVERSDAVILSLPGAPEVEAVMDAANGVLSALDDQLILDTTTEGPESAAKYADAVRNAGGRYVTAPYTRASPAGEGVRMMLGGTPEDCAAAEPIVGTLSVDHVRIGDAADAQTFKLMLQLRYACRQAVDAEIVSFGRDNGVDPRVLTEFLEMEVPEGFFGSDFSQDIEGMGSLAIWHKDVGYALDVAHANDTALPIASAVREIYKSTVRNAGPDEGNATAVIQHWRRCNGREGGIADESPASGS